MNEPYFFSILLSGWFALSLMVITTLQLLSAPYGRHIRKGWGPEIPSTWGWVGMELPAIVVPILCFSLSNQKETSFHIFCLSLWLLHYLHRTLIYPFRMRMQSRKMPLLIAVIAFVTNIGVNYLVFRWLFTLGHQKTMGVWWSKTHVLVGTLIFIIGFIINRQSDATLRALRRPGDIDYKIPHGGLYRWVSCPNYLGEIIQWSGWLCLTWNLASLAFVVWSVANLLPRAIQHHRWYQTRFGSYPNGRRAIIPFIL